MLNACAVIFFEAMFQHPSRRAPILARRAFNVGSKIDLRVRICPLNRLEKMGKFGIQALRGILLTLYHPSAECAVVDARVLRRRFVGCTNNQRVANAFRDAIAHFRRTPAR